MLTMFCSAIHASKNRSGYALRKRSAYVEFFTSPSSATMRRSAAPTRTRALPYASRVAIVAAAGGGRPSAVAVDVGHGTAVVVGRRTGGCGT